MNAAGSSGARSLSVERARSEVHDAEERLHERIQEAKALGEATVKRTLSAAWPVLLGAAVVGGVALTVSALRHLDQEPRRVRIPRRRSLAAEMLRAAVISLASVASRRLSERYLLIGPGAPSTTNDGVAVHRPAFGER